MKLQVFCVKDRATEVFGTPMFMLSVGQANRSFTDEVNREGPDNQIYQHPDDFDLYALGSFDSESGEFATSTPVVVARGKDVAVRDVEKSGRSLLRGVN